MGLLELLDALMYAVDTPGAYARGALAGKAGQRMGGREMLTEWGWTDPNDPNRWESADFAGFAADAIVDPLNLIPAGALAGALGLKGAAAVKGMQGTVKGQRLGRSLTDMLAAVENVSPLPSVRTSAAVHPSWGPPYDELSNAMHQIGYVGQKSTETGAEFTPTRLLHSAKTGFDQHDPEYWNTAQGQVYGPGVYHTDRPDDANIWFGANKRDIAASGAKPNTRMEHVVGRSLDTRLELGHHIPANTSIDEPTFVKILDDLNKRYPDAWEPDWALNKYRRGKQIAAAAGETFTDDDVYKILLQVKDRPYVFGALEDAAGVTNLRHTPYAAGTKHSNWLTFGPEYVIPEFPSPDKARSLVDLIAELLNSGKFPANPPLF